MSRAEVKSVPARDGSKGEEDDKVETNVWIASSKPKSVTEILTWRIESFSRLHCNHDDAITSPTFEVGPHKFHAMFFPRGRHKPAIQGSCSAEACRPITLIQPEDGGQLSEADKKANENESKRRCMSCERRASSFFVYCDNKTPAWVTCRTEFAHKNDPKEFRRLMTDKEGYGYITFLAQQQNLPGDCLELKTTVTVHYMREPGEIMRPLAVRKVEAMQTADAALQSSFQREMFNKWRALYKTDDARASGKESKEAKSLDEDVPVQEIDAVKFTTASGTVHHARMYMLQARSRVFAAMFAHGTEESKTRRIVLDNLKNSTALEAMLEYVHVGMVTRLPKDTTERLETLTELLKLAHLYEMQPLVSWCCDHLVSQISAANLTDLLILADLHDCPDLKAACLEFVSEDKKHLEQARKTERFGAMRPELVAELFDAAHEKKIAGRGLKRKAEDEPERWKDLTVAQAIYLNTADLRDALRSRKLSDKGMFWQLRIRLIDALEEEEGEGEEEGPAVPP